MSSHVSESVDGNVVAEPGLEALRTQHQVRLLTDQEEGCGVPWLPDGVYGFTSAVMQRDAPFFKKPIYQGYEVHKRPDGAVFIIGFVSLEDAGKLDAGETFVTIHLLPERREGASELVAIPLAHVLRHKEHSQRLAQGLELELDTGQGEP